MMRTIQDGMFLVWDSAVIDDRMQYVKIGHKIWVTFECHAKNKKNQHVNLFKVEVAKSVSYSKAPEPGTVVIKEERHRLGGWRPSIGRCVVKPVFSWSGENH
jgi:hypothetical protein